MPRKETVKLGEKKVIQEIEVIHNSDTDTDLAVTIPIPYEENTYRSVVFRLKISEEERTALINALFKKVNEK